VAPTEARAAPQGLADPAQPPRDACGVGFVAHLKGVRSHDIVVKALTILQNLLHRGAVGAEEDTGDGVGILLQIPHRFLSAECARLGIPLPAEGEYGVGMVFLPRAADARRRCEEVVAEIAAEEGQRLLGWRDVPTDDRALGASARATAPAFRQCFIGRAAGLDAPFDGDAFERKLYVIRKRAENEISASGIPEHHLFYLPSLSHRTLIYKGMLMGDQFAGMFPDLLDPRLESALALVHQRFSTNTFPTWPLAHPFRYIAHNGEINTLRGNINWMRAREELCASPLFGADLRKIFPVIPDGGSDSAAFDNVVEFLHMAGRPLPHAILMMIPEAWSGHATMAPDRRAFYEYHGCLMEPWDGPASIAFTDGRVIGAVLDRNGLRPSRYYVTKDDLVVMASEVGVLDLPPESVAVKGRLHPGRIFLVDTVEGRIVDDAELKGRYIQEHPYAEWLKRHYLSVADLPPPRSVPEPDHGTVLRRQILFGYTYEDLNTILAAMARTGMEPMGSMGVDTALAVLSPRPRLLFDYFKQLFAQVTNPPLDGIREELVTQISVPLGPEGNLLDPRPESCRLLRLDSPLLDNAELARIRELDRPGFQCKTLSILYPVVEGEGGLRAALKRIYREADEAIAAGYTYLILSDRHTDRELAPIPSLLATSALQNHLVRTQSRCRVGLLVETGDAREVHHFALLLGYGAGGVNPYLAFESIDDLLQQGDLSGLDRHKAEKNFIKAVNKGLIKVLSKMGISTIQSYRGAQIFEALGLHQDLVDHYFTHTPSRIGGIGLAIIAEEVRLRHREAYPIRPVGAPELPAGGEYRWRRDGEYHLFNPDTVAKLQAATRTGDPALYREFAGLVNEQDGHPATLRSLFTLKSQGAIPIEEVEPVEALYRRFSTGAMSFGSISAEAHETLAIAMNRIGGRSNSGEGGEDPARYRPLPNGDSKRSAIKQVASGRFGVTAEYLTNCTDIQIKMAQGAKPGEGGQLPGDKVSVEIARVRHSTPGVGLISPPPHHDIYSIEDLAQLIHDLKNANPEARVHVKLVAEVGVGTVAAGVAKARADVVLISGYDGGTGASPISSIKHAGLPWELGLAEAHQILVQEGLRDRIVVQVDGQMKTGRDVVVAALLGAEEYGFATAPLVVMGCIMMRVCHLNTCPVGVATQDERLRARFAGRVEHVVNYFRFVAEEVRALMAELGFRTVDEMIGRADLIEARPPAHHWKAQGLDFSRLLARPQVAAGSMAAGRAVYCTKTQDHGLDLSLDRTVLLPACQEAIETGKPVEILTAIRNVHRTVGTLLGHEITKRHGAAGLPPGTIQIHLSGSAGQSLGAFLPPGVSIHLEGDANDYLGKGLSGGKISVFPSRVATFVAEKNVLIGNVALYGATSGEIFIRGLAGERFCVRNSGALAVVEGVGDHGCEYMTGGRVVVLGPTGRNFAAGMSGGIAFVLDPEGDFAVRCNLEMVDLDPVSEGDAEALQMLILRHFEATWSAVASILLGDWEASVTRFVKVFPKDYKRVLATMAAALPATGGGQAQREVVHG
jgi:glutamate synthase (ferredoxin)